MRLVTVKTFSAAAAAHLARQALEDHGIRAFVHDEHMVHARVAAQHGIRGIKLVVAPSDLAAARRLLVPPRDYGEETCPACLSGRLTKRRLNVVLRFLMAIFMGAKTPPARTRCEECGHTP